MSKTIYKIVKEIVPIRFIISYPRAIELYNINLKTYSQVFAVTRHRNFVSSEKDLNDELGNGRTTLWIDPKFFNQEEYDYFIENDANFFHKGNYAGLTENPIYHRHNICLLGVKKETYPGIYWIGEC